MKTAVQIAVTGAAGQISYALLFRLIGGELAGLDRPVFLRLLDVPEALPSLRGVVMELIDCAPPLLASVVVSADPREVFENAELAFLLGARPRVSGMERRDLLQMNAEIFRVQGQALNDVARPDVKVLVVGNPANTNALIAARNAPRLSRSNFSAMTRLDQNRAVAQLAQRCACPIDRVKRVVIWGNHSSSQYPDIHHALVDGRPALDCAGMAWFQEQFIPGVQQRGASVILARGKSSAASAANAAIGAMGHWIRGTAEGEWTSMAVLGDGSYGISQDIVYSYPVTISNGQFRIVSDLPISDFSKARMRQTEAELLEEREMVRHLL
jgi:malate dehydrogenase